MVDEIRQLIDSPDAAGKWLASCGIKNPTVAVGNLQSLADLPWSSADFARVAEALQRSLPTLADPDRALNNLERLTSSSAAIAEQSLNLCLSQSRFYPLLTVLSDSQYLADLLRDRRCFDIICNGQFQRVARQRLIRDAIGLVSQAKNQAEAMRLIRQFKRENTLRIAWGDLVLGHRFEQVASQISFVAAAICEAALFWCRRRMIEKFGPPASPYQDCRFVVLALGKLGGNELNYSSDIDLIAVYEIDAKIRSGSKSTNYEYFVQLTRDFIQMIGQPTELGSAYRVDMRLRPSGSQGPVCKSFRSTIQYYDLQGRTWERQAMIKARPIAGDRSLGLELLEQLQSWVFRPTIGHADIAGVKALKRQIEKRAIVRGDELSDIKAGYGGIRDVEFVIQFMQLLNGWNLPALRTANTVRAIGRLERNHCLTHDEAQLLTNNYRWLRTLEHRLQIMNDQQTHRIPESKDERAAIARRMGFHDDSDADAVSSFERRLQEVTRLNRTILDHLLHGSFGTKSVFRGDSESVSDEVDLILEPHPSLETIDLVLSKYGFRNIDSSYEILMQLTEESSQFVSSRRCKHFFASIAATLLTSISRTPLPDRTLVSLSTISESLGAKGVLWELFSESPSTLELYVRLCASSEYLASILKSNPGMVDELLDALQLDSLPDNDWIRKSLDSLLRGAVDPAVIVSSFKTTQHLRIGIRDILGQDQIAETHRALADVAEACLEEVAKWQYNLLIEKCGLSSYRKLEDTMFVILGLGKLGGCEPNYHSDLDVIFLFHGDEAFESSLPEGMTAQSFFNELGMAISNAVGSHGTRPRLYELDSRLRPTGGSGTLAVHIDEFLRYFRDGAGQLWERQALCKARVVLGNQQGRIRTEEAVHEILSLPLPDDHSAEIWKMRLAMQDGCNASNLKRGPGGTVDIEFAVQMLQLRAYPHATSSGTLSAIEQLKFSGFLDSETAQFLARAYERLRQVESGIRLMNTTARHDLPDNEEQLRKLAYLLNFESSSALRESVAELRAAVRARVLEIFG